MRGPWVALIRGINVGRAKRVGMADLRQALESDGCEVVGTVLQSGNVVLRAGRTSAKALAGRVERVLREDLGVEARVTCLDGAPLEEAIAADPLAGTGSDPSRVQVVVPLEQDGLRRLAPLSRNRWTPESLVVADRVAWLWCPDGVIRSPLVAAVNEALDDGLTMRNPRPMRRIVALGGASAS